MRFTDTFHESEQFYIEIARSHDKAKLNEIQQYLESEEYQTLSTEYDKIKYDLYEKTEEERYAASHVTASFSFGDLELKIYCDDYYGSGSISYFNITETVIVESAPFV